MADKLIVTGARGPSVTEVARRTGYAGVLPTDSDDVATHKMASFAIASGTNAEAGEYLVRAAGNTPLFVGASGTGADAGLRTDIGASTGALLMGTADGGNVQAALDAKSEKNEQPLSLFEFIPRNLWASIVGRTVNNNKANAQALADYIQDGIDAAATQRRKLHVPAGLYNIAPVETFASEAGPCNRCFAIRSYMEIEAEAGATFRVVNGVSSDASPVFMCMFGSNEILNNVAWRGLEMDMNGANNLFSPNRNTPALPNNGYNLYNQAHIYVSGTVGGQAARINNARVERCRLINTYGVNCIVMGQSNVLDSGMGKKWRILDCEFAENGFDTIDHSSVYGWADDVIVARSRFRNSTPFNVTGGLVAFEVHGSNTHFTDNIVENYFQMLWLDGNFTSITRGTVVTNNQGYVGAFGIMFFGVTPDIAPPIQTVISNNRIEFDNNVYPGIDLKIGIGTTGNYSQVDALISLNRVVATGTATASAGFAFAAGSVAGQKHDKMVICNNVAEGTTFGATLSTSAASGLGIFTLASNTFFNLSDAGAFTVPIGIAVTGNPAKVIDHLILIDNQCIDDRLDGQRQCDYGIRLEGPITRLDASGNRARGMLVADYAEAGTSITTRSDTKFQGVDATVFKVNGTQVVGPRGAAIADATDEASAITAINAWLAAARTHGLIPS